MYCLDGKSGVVLLQRVQPFVNPVPHRPDYRPAHIEGPVGRADVAVVVGQEVQDCLISSRGPAPVACHRSCPRPRRGPRRPRSFPGRRTHLASWAGSRVHLTSQQLDAVSATAKVRGVERRKPALPVGRHGCDDVCVVDPPSSHRNLATQSDQRIGCDGAILKHLEGADESLHVIERVRRLVFAYNLAADRRGFRVLKGALQPLPGGVDVLAPETQDFRPRPCGANRPRLPKERRWPAVWGGALSPALKSLPDCLLYLLHC